MLDGIRLISPGKVVSNSTTCGGTMKSTVKIAIHRGQMRLKMSIPLQKAKIREISKICGRGEERACRLVSK